MAPKLLLRAPEGAGRDLQTGHQGRPRSVYGSARSARYIRRTAPLSPHGRRYYSMSTRPPISWSRQTSSPGLVPQVGFFLFSAKRLLAVGAGPTLDVADATMFLAGFKTVIEKAKEQQKT